MMWFFLFFLSLSGICILFWYHRDAVFALDVKPSFRILMDSIKDHIWRSWDEYMRDKLLLFLEKQLRWTRILVLKIERHLFRITHKVRSMSDRNGTSGNDTIDT